MFIYYIYWFRYIIIVFVCSRSVLRAPRGDGGPHRHTEAARVARRGY